MKKRIITISIVAVSLISFVSGFCAPILAHAASFSDEMNHRETMHFEQHMETLHEAGDKGALLPCCDNEQKDSAIVALSASSLAQEKIQLSLYSTVSSGMNGEVSEKRPIDIAYLTSPPGGGLVSTTIKNE